MAEPVVRAAGAVPLMEEAVRLLRQARFGTLICHAAGSVPLAIGLLVFWNSLTSQRLSDRSCALQALGLALLLGWMNCWRAVFAGCLRRLLSGGESPRWTWARIARLAAGQSFLGASKLVVLPLAGLIGFPFASAVAFYRTTAALADDGDCDPLAMMARARAVARIYPGQAWAVLPVLAFLQIVLALNLALTFAILPLLVRMLTGYESAFSRGEAFFVENPLFVVFVLVTTWIVFDPFVQAVYTVRAFHGESAVTGEDLRVALRRIRATGALAAIFLLWAVVPARSAGPISPLELERSVQKAMQAPEYGWRIPPPPATGISSRPWVLRVADKIVGALNSAWSFVAKGIGKLIEWLFGKLGNAPAKGQGVAPRGALHWSLYFLIAVVAGGALWTAWRQRMFRRAARPRAVGSAPAIRIDEEDIAADRLPEERWMEMALDCLREENYRLALRACYLANLAWLGQHGFVAIHAGKTNREYEIELRRKARQYAEARSLFGANVSAFEAAWYGMHEVTEPAVAEFRRRIEGMKRGMA